MPNSVHPTRRADLLQTVDGPTMAKAKLAIHDVDKLGDVVRLALHRAGIAQKEAAILMDLDQSRFVRQLAGKEPLSFARMCERLPAEFWRELICLLGPFCGFEVRREITLKENVK